MAMPDIETIIYYYCVVSIVVGVSTIGYGVYGAHEPVAIFLNTSNVASAVLINTVVAAYCLIQMILIFLVLGSLREDEGIILSAHGKNSTLFGFLALCKFTKGLQQPPNLALLVILMTIEPFHSLMLHRLEHLGGAHSEPPSMQIRLLAAIAVFTVWDLYVLYFIGVQFAMKRDCGVHIYIGFWYFYLAISTFVAVYFYSQKVKGQQTTVSRWSPRRARMDIV
jgi:hypothetical protein